MVTFLLGIIKTAGRFVLEFTRTLIIDTVVGAMLNPYAQEEQPVRYGGKNIVCL